jgi:hypothetical protein
MVVLALRHLVAILMVLLTIRMVGTRATKTKVVHLVVETRKVTIMAVLVVHPVGKITVEDLRNPAHQEIPTAKKTRALIILPMGLRRMEDQITIMIVPLVNRIVVPAVGQVVEEMETAEVMERRITVEMAV